jgi:hypothetical protein
MTYTPETRAIAARLGEVSRRFQETVEAQRRDQIDTGQNLVDAVVALTAAIDRSNELIPLFREYGDTFNELMDSIADPDDED